MAQFNKTGVRFILALCLSLFCTNMLFYYWDQHRRQSKESSGSSPVSTLIDDVKSDEYNDECDPFKHETIYCIENEFMQVVVTSVGASIIEINIPFDSDNSPTRVRPVGIDKDLANGKHENSLFPMNDSVMSSGRGGLLEYTTKIGGHYPLLRRGIEGRSRISDKLRCLSIVSDYENIDIAPYDLVSLSQDKIVMKSTMESRKITKTIELSVTAPYLINTSVHVEGDCRGLWITSGVPDIELLSSKPCNSVFFRHANNFKSELEGVPLPKCQYSNNFLNLQWVGNSNGFFGLILEPKNFSSSGFRVNNVSGFSFPSRFIKVDSETGKSNGYQASIPLPSKPGSYELTLFAGPLSNSVLSSIDNNIHDPGNSSSPDYYGCHNQGGWLSFISAPFVRILSWLLPILYSVTGSWTLSIILLTVFLRIVLHPLNAKSLESMEKIKKLSPIVNEIQERYKTDPQMAKIEIFNLYRDNKVNPFSGFLPLLAQMPFLFAMFDLLRSRFELRGAVAVPGWIDNLSAPDVLFSWNYNLPIIGKEFHVLPFILGIVMFLQQYVTSRDSSGKSVGSLHFGALIALLFVVMFYGFPAGLNIYWLSSMLLGIAQQCFIRR